MNSRLIALVYCLRDAQKEFEEKNTRSAMILKVKYENEIDAWLAAHTKENEQLELWCRTDKSSELPGVYNLSDNEQTKAGGAA